MHAIFCMHDTVILRVGSFIIKMNSCYTRFYKCSRKGPEKVQKWAEKGPEKEKRMIELPDTPMPFCSMLASPWL